jgi:hypothetical protein
MKIYIGEDYEYVLCQSKPISRNLLYLELSRGYLRQWRRIQIDGLEFESYEVELSDFELL